jgi:hypothetical protein
MNVASITPIAMSHGLWRGFQSSCMIQIKKMQNKPQPCRALILQLEQIKKPQEQYLIPAAGETAI